MASRYDNLNEAISSTANDSKKNKPFRIVEIGVHHGVRATAMIKFAKKVGRTNIEYYGFDLFEDMTVEVNANEFGKPALAMNREEIRQKLIAAGASKVQLVKGDTRVTLEQAVTGIPTANVVFVDGGHSLETITSDLEGVLHVCGANTHILLDDCYPGIFDKGCAFLLKCTDVLKKHGITLTELDPVDTFDKNPYGQGPLQIKVLRMRCTAQLTPNTLKGFGNLLMSQVSPCYGEPEPKEFFPEKSFLPEGAIGCTGPTGPQGVEGIEEAAPACTSKEASVPAGGSFQDAPAYNSCGNSDVQPVRLCENSCGKLPGEHCERDSDSCGRREPAVEPGNVVEVSQDATADVQIPPERQEFDTVMEQGNQPGLGAPCPSDNSGELRSEVPPPVESGSRRVSRRRRRRGGADDECTGPQA